MDIKIGADPELFLWDTKAKKFVSAAGFFPGTKKQPYSVDKGAIQVDGVALEFNIDAASNEDEFFNNINTVMTQMKSMVREVNPDWELKYEPYATFKHDVWETVPEDAKELGCDPDYNCHGTVNPNPTEAITNSAKLQNLGAIRTASGHVHIGFSEDEDVTNPLHFEDCRFISHQFYNRRVFQPEVNSEWNRLSFYGNNGAFRPKKYGVELRSPSNRWLLTEQKVRETFRKTAKTFMEVTGA